MKTSRVISAFVSSALIMTAFAGCAVSEDVKEKTIMLENVSQISADLSSTDLRIKLGDENKLHYKVYESLIPTVSQKDGRLTITTGEDRGRMFGTSDNNYIELTLTEKTLDMLDIEVSSADITIDGFNISGEIESSSGDVDINGSKSGKDLKITTSSGDLDLSDCSFGKLDCELTSGDTGMKKVTADSVTFDTTSGDIEASALDAKDIDIEATSGDVDLEVKGKESDYRWEFYCTSGDVELGGSERNDGYKSNDGAERSCTVKTTSGDTTITFA